MQGVTLKELILKSQCDCKYWALDTASLSS